MQTFVKRNNNLAKYTPSINIKYENDKRHLATILQILSKVPPYELISFIDHKKREIEAGIKEARRRLDVPSIEPQMYLALELGLEKWVENKNDIKIISDSVTWAEKQKEEISLVSNDFSDIIKNREDIYYCVCSYRPYDFSEKPFVIESVLEINTKHIAE